jgi:MoxR-like ATPase
MDTTLCNQIIKEASRVIVGKSDALELILVALLAESHILLEDVPGVGKTLMAKTLAKAFGGSFRRIQFTPDLLPSDVTGFTIYDQHKGEFRFQEGPVMANILLADEINRAIPRTQSSLLESMEEGQTTVDGRSYPLPTPFFVMATQNPIELEGTFPLPEAQLDRFLLKIDVGYPDKEEEMAILTRFQEADPLAEMDTVATPVQIVAMQEARRRIHVSVPVADYITGIVRATREHRAFRFGASPRGSIGLMRAAQGLAAVRGRDYVLPDDVKSLAIPVLAHRLILTEAERMRGTTPEAFLSQIVNETPIPDPAG